MRKEWQPMKVQILGQVREVVQGSRGKYSPPAPDFAGPIYQQEVK